VLEMFRRDLGALLEFDRGKILSGDVWRLVPFLFSSSGFAGIGVMGILFFFFMVMIAFMMNDALEGAWGVFKTSIFHYCGVLGLIAANFLMPDAMPGSGFLIYGTSFFAFATLFPRVEFRLFFVLPVQVRFIAILMAIPLVWNGFTSLAWWGVLGLTFGNYLIWAGIPALRGKGREVHAMGRRRKFNAAASASGAVLYQCAVCQRTNTSDPQLEFRVATDGRDYCSEHLPE